MSSPASPMPFLSAVPKRILLACCFLVLHAVLVLGASSPLGKSLWMVHLGLFILWQPFVGLRQALSWTYLLLGALLFAALLWVGNWALILWMLLLAGMVGGRVFFHDATRLRVFYLIAFVDLLGCLLLIAVPQAIGATYGLAENFRPVAHSVLPILLVAALLWSLPVAESEDRGTVDLLYSVFLILFLSVQVAGAIAVMHVRGSEYFPALLTMLIVMAALVLALALVWTPRFGFAGLASVASRYMLAEGLPFEQLLRDLGQAARQAANPEDFIVSVAPHLPQYLRGSHGLRWQLGRAPAGEWGGLEGISHSLYSGELRLDIYSRRALSPTLLWHARLFTQLVADYCRTLDQAQRLQEMSYIAAVHQTGARLTHDVKNLLQSLNALCAACQTTDPDQARDLQGLMGRQLPAISQRLQATLGKLNHPGDERASEVSADRWWSEIQARYADRNVAFVLQGHVNAPVPAALFDSGVENLLQNAFDKRALEVDLRIVVTLSADPKGWCLSVLDDGTAVPAAIAARWGHVFPGTENGLGVGLYHLIRQAVDYGYQLQLKSNLRGAVCFELAPQTQR